MSLCQAYLKYCGRNPLRTHPRLIGRMPDLQVSNRLGGSCKSYR